MAESKSTDASTSSAATVATKKMKLSERLSELSELRKSMKAADEAARQEREEARRKEEEKKEKERARVRKAALAAAEIAAAEAAQIPVIPRAEMLAELMRMKYGIAVAGTHGKTTTTSMLATVLHHAGIDPTIVIGGRLDSMGSSARLGAGEFLVAEADESDGSFMLLDPTVAIVTNIDPEHLEHWGSMDALVDRFCDFANKVPFFGFSTLCLDHPVVQSLIPRIRRRIVTYGFNAQADVRGERLEFDGIATRVHVRWRGNSMGQLHLNMPGRHNVSNALAAVAVGLELDIPFDAIAEGLDGFSGVDRRFSVRAEVDLGGDAPVTIIDD